MAFSLRHKWRIGSRTRSCRMAHGESPSICSRFFTGAIAVSPARDQARIAMEPNSLSIHRSFVVQLYASNDLDAGEISGRVEHVVSGEAKEFWSVAELLSSIGLLLRLDDLR